MTLNTISASEEYCNRRRTDNGVTRYRLTLGLFVRSLAFLYFISFTHLVFQVVPLVGAKGISPIAMFLNRTSSIFGQNGNFLGKCLIKFQNLPKICRFFEFSGEKSLSLGRIFLEFQFFTP